MKLFGNYRAQVVENKDPDKFGKVKVWIADIMPNIDPDKGIWAKPANNPMGGRNEDSGEEEALFSGTSYIPGKGTWCWVFFEAGDLQKPFYWGALDLENAKVLPENQLGKDYQKKWTIIKTNKGRCIVTSDDTDDERVEITGKKRTIKEPPSGDTNSVYTIDGNQTTILIDERSGKEKVLIRTHKGDFFHIDVDDQKLQGYFKGGINLKTDGDYYLQAKGIYMKATDALSMESAKDMNIKSGSILNVESGNDMNINSGGTLHTESSGALNIKSGDAVNIESSMDMNLKSGGVSNILSSAIVGIDGASVSIMGGVASAALSAEPAESATSSKTEEPKGERDT